MNKVSGYKAIQLQDGTQVELKFGMGALEIFGEMIGVNTLEQAVAKLNPDLDEAGQPIVTFGYLATIRKLLFSAAKFAALSQNKPFDYNEFAPSNWIEEVGLPEILAVMDIGGESPQVTAEDAKKKPKDRLRATQ